MVKYFPSISIKRLIFSWRKRTRNDGDIAICIYGDEGIGKSNLGILCSILSDAKFNFIDNAVWTNNPEEVINKVKNLPKKSVLYIDEAIKVLEKQQWSKSTWLKILYNTIRGRNLITIFVLPRLIDLTEYFRNHRIYQAIYVHWKGFACVINKTRIPNVSDPFNIKYNNWIMEQLDNAADDIAVMQKMQEMKGFRGFINFPVIPKKIKDVYLKFKMHYDLLNILEENNTEDSPKDKKRVIWLAKLIRYLKESGSKIKDIMSITGQNKNEVNYYLYNVEVGDK
jgi:hypothetical protein